MRGAIFLLNSKRFYDKISKNMLERRMRMKSFVAGKNDSGQRLDKFISKSVPSLPSSLMYKYIRKKRIKVNSKRADIDTRLSEGDVIEMYISDEFFDNGKKNYDFLTASKNLKIVYEDENIILADKPAGVLSHPDETEFNDTLITRIKRYLYEKGEYDPESENSFAPSLVNRIDRNTAGIVIAAKNSESLRILNQKLKDREIEKYYLCVVHGEFEKKKDKLTAYMIKDESKNKVSVYSKPVPGAKTMITGYEVLKQGKNMSLLEVRLFTGRTHQIRAHLAFEGHPLVGDGKYGSNALNKSLGFKKQLLCSYKLQFDFKTDAGILNYLNGKSFRIEDVWFEREFPDFGSSETK